MINRRNFLALACASVIAAPLPSVAAEVDVSDKMIDMLKGFSFEPNNESTRNAVLDETKEIFRSSGISDCVVCCDESNNSPEVVDNNMLNVFVRYDNRNMNFNIGPRG